MPRYFIVNDTTRNIREYKPGIGEFVIPPGEKVEVFDVIDKMDTPKKTQLEYVRYSAKEVAEALLGDFGNQGLRLEVIE